ncbi:major head protein [Dinoroseobacter phage vB_DshS-R5C]|uniref:Coat protein n=1 Tax=Dinoroseobacter phage vB_DshS-R5C TaxID=1965368 RepID=A0A1V0DY80_9CAUD|nr:major head protein [Dinoroseobacter phage vB_DshS-R5C]ARB06105.1 coat protein [Dinoroseobacter phage vB_DshS-R5C]
MANTLGNYNPEFYAQEALIQLFKALGMAGRVHRGAEQERNSAGNQKGDTINLKRPTKFTAAEHVAGTGSAVQDVVGENIAIVLNNHQEVKYKLTDRELAYTTEQIITDHITPAAYALADKIDQDLHALGSRVGPKAFVSGTASSAFITGPRKVLRNNEVPMDPGMIHYLVDSGMEAAFLDLGIFHEARITGEGANAQALMNGSLGQRFGVEVFASQNADVDVAALSSTATASAATGDPVLAVNNASGYSANTSTIAVDGGTAAETFQVGDTFTIAGDPTVYTLTAATTLSTGAGNLTFYPALRRNVADDAVVTFNLLNAIEEAAHVRNLMFHRNAFALAFAPLPMTGDGRGAEMATVTDEITGLSVRARMWYDGGTASNFVALDALYGTQVLDPMLGVQVKRATSVYPA